MFNSFEDVKIYLGRNISRRIPGYARTLLALRPALPGGIVLVYRYNNTLLTFYPQHIVLNTTVYGKNGSEAVRKRVHDFLPDCLKIRTRQGEPMLIDVHEIGHPPTKGTVMDWDGRIIKPFQGMSMILDDIYHNLFYGYITRDFDESFSMSDCFLCGTSSEGVPLTHALGLDYHFLEHLNGGDTRPRAMLLDICFAYYKAHDAHRFLYEGIVNGLLGERDLTNDDMMFMATAFKWFIKDRLDYEVTL